VSKDVKTLQALLNLFLTAGDVGEDGTPIPPLALDGTSRSEDEAGGAGLSRRRPILRRTVLSAPLTWKKLIEQDF